MWLLRKCNYASDIIIADRTRTNFTDRYPLLVIFHDPPNLISSPDVVSGKTELHNMWLVSSTVQSTLYNR